VFIKKQYEENRCWLHELYEYLGQAPNYYSFIKQKPLFIDKNQNAVPAFDEKCQLLFPPVFDETEYNTIHVDFLENETTIKFFEAFEIFPPDVCVDVIHNIFPKYTNGENITIDEYKKDLNKILLAMKTDSSSRKENLLERANETPFIRSVNNDNQITFQKPFLVYFNEPELRIYFSNTKSVWFLDSICKDVIPEEILIKFGVSRLPKRISIDNISYVYHKKGIKDYHLDGLKDFLSMLGNLTTFEEQKEKSLLLWNILKQKIDTNQHFFHADKYWFYYSQHHGYIENSILQQLKEKNWIPTKNNKLESPKNITIDLLVEEIGQDTELIKALNIPEKDSATMIQEQLEEKANELGVSLEDIELIKNNPDEFIKFKESLTRPKNPSFPQKTVRDSDKRRDIMAEKFANAEDKAYAIRLRRVRVNSVSPGEKKTYFENYYTNDDGIMVCQICEKEMSFQKRDGTYYYEAVEIFPDKRLSKYLSKDLPEQYIALCPECSARYNEYVVCNGSVMNKLECHIINGTDLWLHLGDVSENNHEPFTKNIRFVETHLIDLQIILRKESNG
jgi:hypothetical protein